MRALIQRVSQACIVIDGNPGGSMNAGMVVLLGIERGDTANDLDWLLNKCLDLRIYEDSEGKMNRSLRDSGGQVMVVSQFTLYGNVKKGNRPSFNRSAAPAEAIPLYNAFVEAMRQSRGSANVITGAFGANMQVTLTNDGPVTLLLDSRNKEL